jgi:sugar lactone lactonase YvrE
MNNQSKYFRGVGAWISLPMLILIMGLGIIIHTSYAVEPDSLYIGDSSDNTIKRFDATTANFQGIFVKGGIKGPMGLIFDSQGNLIVSNQNANTSTDGELLLYAGSTGKLLRRIVANSDPNAPGIPRGIVQLDVPLHGIDTPIIYVAEFSEQNSNGANKPLLPGRLLVYRETDGQLLAAITPPLGLIPRGGQFHPRGVVFGPDGLLYISNVPDPPPPVSTGLGGQVLRYHPDTGAFDLFVDDPGGSGQLNRPEGLVFGPDRRLYITSFRADSSDTDSIRIYNADGSPFSSNIVLEVNSTRAFAQALLFGPCGSLFVPITSTGEVRRYYDIPNNLYQTFVASGGPLGSGWYLTFGKTDSKTLEYQGDECR